MKLIGVRAAQMAAMMLLCVCAVSAQQAEMRAGKVPQMTSEDVAPRGAAVVAAGEPLALLPPSDLVAVIDVGRVFEALLPKLMTLAPDEIAKLTKELEAFAAQTSVDLRQIKTAVIGVKLPVGNVKSARGAIILQGLELDPQKFAALLKAERGELKTLTHQGKTFFLITPPKGKTTSGKTPTGKASASKAQPGQGAGSTAASSAAASLGLDEIAFAMLDQGGVVAGDVASVKSVLDAQAGAGQNSNALLGEALNETSPSSWIRFAANLSDGFRQEVLKLGEIFQPLATVQVIAGSLAFDTPDGAAAALDLKLRTASADEAARLEAHLKNLVFMGQSLLGESKDPQMRGVNQLFDQIQIAAQTSTVTVSIFLPKELLEMFDQPKKKIPAMVTR
jgi:predicted flap endonuclease-1-like 5' DNA nuclease